MDYEDSEVDKWSFLGFSYRSTCDEANRIQMAVEVTPTYQEWVATKRLLKQMRVRDEWSLQAARTLAVRLAELNAEITPIIEKAYREIVGSRT